MSFWVSFKRGVTSFLGATFGVGFATTASAWYVVSVGASQSVAWAVRGGAEVVRGVGRGHSGTADL